MTTKPTAPEPFILSGPELALVRVALGNLPLALADSRYPVLVGLVNRLTAAASPAKGKAP